MLGICYTCVALCCSAHGCHAVEYGVACCTAQHTAIAILTDVISLVDSGANYSFVTTKLVEKYQLTINLGTSMVVTLADGSQVTTSETCSIPIITCTMSNKSVCCVI